MSKENEQRESDFFRVSGRRENESDKQGAFPAPKGMPNVVGMHGWVCPKCGRVYSPFTSMCPYCVNDGINYKQHITC